jgi:hypothetical protein
MWMLKLQSFVGEPNRLAHIGERYSCGTQVDLNYNLY